MFTVFSQTVESITDYIAPVKKRCKLIRKCEFLNTELMEMKQKRRKLERMYRKHKISFQNTKSMIGNCFVKKREHFEKKLNATETDSEKYKALDKLSGNKTGAVLPFHNSNVTLSNDFNVYFTCKLLMLCMRP